MDNAGVGWIAAIVIGGIAGWLAEQFMKSSMGMIVNNCRCSDCRRHFELLRHRLGRMDRLPDFRFHWGGLADLDRSDDTARLKT